MVCSVGCQNTYIFISIRDYSTEWKYTPSAFAGIDLIFGWETTLFFDAAALFVVLEPKSKFIPVVLVTEGINGMPQNGTGILLFLGLFALT